ncbi:MAG: hypothetical protein OEM24_05895 [Paracoccaceae bacterium]|nr:hypothetical protein [Paracoccaceae bacterium]
MEQLIIGLISGAVGGNVAGAGLKNFSLGPLLNSVVGAVGGAGGGQILSMLGGADAAAGLDLGAIIGQVAGGGIGGAVLTAVAGFIKNAMAK